MAKTQVNASCPSNVDNGVKRYQRENDLGSKSEAARQLIERGIKDWEEESPGETLARQGTTIAAVAGISAALMLPFGATWALPAAAGLAASTLIFGSLWLAIRTIAGRGVL